MTEYKAYIVGETLNPIFPQGTQGHLAVAVTDSGGNIVGIYEGNPVNGNHYRAGDTIDRWVNVGMPSFRDGFAALASLDGNDDGVFDAMDAMWGVLRIWKDGDGDGETDEGELQTLTQVGVSSISVDVSLTEGRFNQGNEVLAVGTWRDGNGQGHDAWAVRFIANPDGVKGVVEEGALIVQSDSGLRSYVATSAEGETIDLAAKNVRSAYGGAGDDKLTGMAGKNWLSGGAAVTRCQVAQTMII